MKQQLVYDVGFHRGEDTDFYLRKGFSVIAIEANPQLIASATVFFQDAIAAGRLHLIEGAVAPSSAGDKIAFYVNPDNSVWSTIAPKWASRNEMFGSRSERTLVNRVDITEVYRSHGIPFYLKVDVEGVDRLVLEELQRFQDRPQYLSLESEKIDFNQLKTEMELLRGLGYKKFKIVQQQTIPGTKIRTNTLEGRPFEYVFESHASGPFGNDLPPPWLTYDETLEQYKIIFRRYKYFGDYSVFRKMPGNVQSVIHTLYRMSTGYEDPLPGWFDTHASL
jgi:FkbM family methyltransferase